MPQEFDRRLSRDPVAIVGLAGMFPKARDVRAFWDNIVAGRDCTEEVPPAWWDPEDFYDPDPFAPDKTYGRRGGFLTPVRFDPMAFGMPPKTLDSTGLVQLLSLMVAREVLNDGACGRDNWYDPGRTGVVLGVCGTNTTLMPLAARLLAPLLVKAIRSRGVAEEEAQQAARDYLHELPAWTEDSFPGILGNVVAGRIANRLDLRAANHTVDAACASSLAAVRAAVDELVCRRADLMITGGCDADNSIVSFMCFSKTPALSFSGRVRPFDAEADGTLIGEGIGMLALKRLADAERDGDRVYAVLRGLGSSSDGVAKSIYAPSKDGQSVALRRAYEDAGCPPDSVELVEAHGTGTPTGDEVEVTTLNELMGVPGDSRHVAVGSIKSQVGHTKAAAGAAGMIKAALALHHKVLPPTVNVESPAPVVTADGAVYVNTIARPWVRDPGRPVRRAGVSAFGFGGVNYHAVLEEHHGGGRQESALHSVPRACLWHAPEPGRLLSLLEGGADPAEDGHVPPDHARLGFVAADDEHRARLLAAAVERLRTSSADEESWRLAEGVHYRRKALTAGTKVAALFTGQGNQYLDMGLRALLAVPPLRDAFDEANALFPPGETLARTVFPPPGDEDTSRAARERLNRTSYAQPAIGALAAGQYRFLRELGFAPDGVLGHSFGELTALWAAGVLGDDAFRSLARARGRAMEERPEAGSDPGAMAVVRAEDGTITALLAAHPEVAVCNRNAPDEQVVGGPTEAVERFMSRCAEQGVPAKRLPVAAAFHTPLVGHAVRPFAEACARMDFAAPAVPVYAGAAGARYGQGPEADRRTLAEQLLQPVDFVERLQQLRADGFGVFVEFGPGSTLTRLVERTLGADAVVAVPCDRGEKGPDSAAVLKEAALRLAVLGRPVAGINRYDAPAPAEQPPPSAVSRVLEGPNFALKARQERLRQQEDRPVTRPFVHAAGGVPASSAAADPLARAAADHLAAHVRYLDGQLATQRELVELLRSRTGNGHGPDAALATTVGAITEHSLAVGEAHIRAGEVVAELLGGTGTTPAASVAPPVLRTANGRADGVEAPERTLAVEGKPGTDRTPDTGGSPGTGGRPGTGPEEDDRSALAALMADDRMLDTPLQDITDVDPEEAERVVRQIVADKTGYDVSMLEPDMHIQEDLGIDSLKQVEIGAEVWRRYPVIKREELFRFSEARTVGDLSTMLKELFTSPRSGLRHSGGVPLGQAYVSLRTLPPVDVLTGVHHEQPCALMLDDGGELCAGLGRALAGRGWSVRRLTAPGVPAGDRGTHLLDGWSEGELRDRLAEALSEAGRIDLCLLPLSRSRTTNVDEAVNRLTHGLLFAKRARAVLLEAAREGRRAAFITVTQLDGCLGYAGSGGDPVAALAGGLAGLVKSAALEAAPVFCRALDFAPDMAPDTVGEALLEEIADVATDVLEVGRDGQHRRTPALSVHPQRLLPHGPGDPAGLTEDDTLLVTGGAGGITAWCLEALAEDHRCGYVIMGRRPEEDDGVRPALEALRSRGVRADYVSADVQDATAVRTALAPHADRITGVLHAAGVLGDRPLTEMTAESTAPVIGTKLSGLQHLLDALGPERLRHLVVFASVAGLWGNVRQADYALANEGMIRHVCAMQTAYPALRAAPIVWGPWEGGMAEAVHRLYSQAGVPVLSREAGTAYFRGLMGPGHPGGEVTVVGPTAPWLRRSDALPAEGLTAVRSLTGLEDEPMLGDHRLAGHPLVPMTGLLGAVLHTVERAQGGSLTAVRCRDVRIVRGLYLDGHHPRAVCFHLAPDEQADAVRVRMANAGGKDGRTSFEGVVVCAEEPGEAPRLDLPPYEPTGTPHPCYTERTIFHGPSLAGLRDVLEESSERLVLSARLRDPAFACGAYAGQLFSPALSDLLLQGAALITHRIKGSGGIPVSAEHVELYAPLPDDEPFVVIAEVVKTSVLDTHCTVTACEPGGRVLQKWTKLRMLDVNEAQAGRLVATYLSSQAAVSRTGTG
ncbi:SDR family NAD(P)-dependent oxidoreductase [Streptomyces nondiastaticus]|uniref:SDR family NAD(P)-dependent oxidoreductase n=1 Tax=Streptomyces nondiastaticus TaxID=3154512 RepID=UPI003435AA8D